MSNGCDHSRWLAYAGRGDCRSWEGTRKGQDRRPHCGKGRIVALFIVSSSPVFLSGGCLNTQQRGHARSAGPGNLWGEASRAALIRGGGGGRESVIVGEVGAGGTKARRRRVKMKPRDGVRQPNTTKQTTGRMGGKGCDEGCAVGCSEVECENKSPECKGECCTRVKVVSEGRMAGGPILFLFFFECLEVFGSAKNRTTSW